MQAGRDMADGVVAVTSAAQRSKDTLAACVGITGGLNTVAD